MILSNTVSKISNYLRLCLKWMVEIIRFLLSLTKIQIITKGRLERQRRALNVAYSTIKRLDEEALKGHKEYDRMIAKYAKISKKYLKLLEVTNKRLLEGGKNK